MKENIFTINERLQSGEITSEQARKELLVLFEVIVPKGTLCECGGTERVGLDCTMKPCKHPKYYKG